LKKEHYIEQLQKLYNEEKYFELEKLCLKLVTTYEESFIYFFLGQAQINLNLTNIGEYHLKKAIFLNPNSVISFNALGDLYLTFQKLEMAKKMFLSSLKIDSNNIKIHLIYIKILLSLNEKKSSLKAIDEALKYFPKSKELKKLKFES